MASEELIRQLTLEAIRQLGPNAAPQHIESVVRSAAAAAEVQAPRMPVPTSSSRVMITAYGYNEPGILAAITQVLAQHRCDVLDMTQKLLQEFFTLMMLVDLGNSPSEFTALQQDLAALGERIRMRILVQHEDVFNAMHRI